MGEVFRGPVVHSMLSFSLQNKEHVVHVHRKRHKTLLYGKFWITEAKYISHLSMCYDPFTAESKNPLVLRGTQQKSFCNRDGLLFCHLCLAVEKIQ